MILYGTTLRLIGKNRDRKIVLPEHQALCRTALCRRLPENLTHSLGDDIHVLADTHGLQMLWYSDDSFLFFREMSSAISLPIS